MSLPNSAPQKSLAIAEFVALMAMMTSIIALTTDMILPALGIIGQDLKVENLNDTQLMISSIFLGLAAGQILAGPISDSFGRKPVIYFGYLVFILGCLLSIYATNLNTMLVGRVMQGFGAAFPRIVSLALVRDCYGGREMARIMSIVMAVFIIVPAIAPALGQGILLFSDWHAMFIVLMAMAIISVVWFATRQAETLAEDARRKFSVTNVWSGIKEAASIRTALGYTIAAGFVFAPFVGYLSSAQHIFQIGYNTGNLFAIYFGSAALAIGLASTLNAKLVMRFGMRWLTIRAIIVSAAISAIFLVPSIMMNGVPPLWAFMVWLMVNFFCMGILFGNLNALAMEPLGHMAGLGAAFVGSLSTFIALPIAWAIGYLFDGGVLPLVSGFAICGFFSLAIVHWTEAPTRESQIASID